MRILSVDPGEAHLGLAVLSAPPSGRVLRVEFVEEVRVELDTGYPRDLRLDRSEGILRALETRLPLFEGVDAVVVEQQIQKGYNVRNQLIQETIVAWAIMRWGRACVACIRPGLKFNSHVAQEAVYAMGGIESLPKGAKPLSRRIFTFVWPSVHATSFDPMDAVLQGQYWYEAHHLRLPMPPLLPYDRGQRHP